MHFVDAYSQTQAKVHVLLWAPLKVCSMNLLQSNNKNLITYTMLQNVARSHHSTPKGLFLAPPMSNEQIIQMLSVLAFSRRILQPAPLHEDRPVFPKARGAARPMPGCATTGSFNPQPDAASVSHTGPAQDSRHSQAAGPDAGPFWPGQLRLKLGHGHLAPKDSHHAQL